MRTVDSYLQYLRSGNSLRSFAVSIGKCEIAKLIDHTGSATGQLMKDRTGIRRKQIRRTSRHPKAVVHVGSGIFLIKRFKRIVHRNALSQLPHVASAQQRAQARLTRQDDLDAALSSVIDIRKEAEVFQHVDVEVLRLIDDKKHLLIRGEGSSKKRCDCPKMTHRILTGTVQPKGIAHPWQEAGGVWMCGRDDSDGVAPSALIKNLVQQRGFSGSCFTGQHGKDGAIKETVFQYVQTGFVSPAQK